MDVEEREFYIFHGPHGRRAIIASDQCQFAEVAAFPEISLIAICLPGVFGDEHADDAVLDEIHAVARVALIYNAIVAFVISGHKGVG